jgi:DNA-binding response OmpR family regulator
MIKNKILVVDDNEPMREALKDTLISKGFEALTASNGAEGLKIALEIKPRVIVSDIQMPIMNGMEMLAELRKSGCWGEKVPIIILTSFDTNEKIMDGIIQNDPSFYLMKSETTPSMIVDLIKEKLGISSTDE